jgi:ubiquinone/menaquinone biosynthesis C-methylase UbiE
VKTIWDYTQHAAAYAKRPDYARDAIEKMLARAGVKRGDKVIDIGAGTGHLTSHLLQHQLDVVAVEPNDAMRAEAVTRFAGAAGLSIVEASAEATTAPTGAFKLVTFGSSFNVTDRPKALRETHRLLAPGGWFACMWNHRDLDDPLQAQIEAVIRARVASYDYGSRREDQSEVVAASGLFEPTETIEGRVIHEIAATDFADGWVSHATLARQAGTGFNDVVAAIRATIKSAGADVLHVPYTTRIWVARAREPV